RLLLLNGPNINRFGKREKEIYGSFTLEDIEEELSTRAKKHAFEIVSLQSNCEGELIDYLHEADSVYDGIICNPAAYTHTCMALHDASTAIDTPVIEVHISNIDQRETLRHHAMTAPACMGQIAGCGMQGYIVALLAFVEDAG